MTIPSPMPAKDSQYHGWQANLALTLALRGNRTAVVRSSQNGPLTIQTPFYPEGDTCHLYLLHPPAGIVGGDTLNLSVTTEQSASALLTTPGATKFYKSNGKRGRQIQRLHVAAGTGLEWLPQETIYFPDTDAELNTEITLEEQAKFFGWEIHCFGLPANNLDLQNGKVVTRLSVTRGNRPLLIETFRISPEKARHQAPFLRGNQIMGSCIATGAPPDLLSRIRNDCVTDDNCLWGATLIDDLLVVRALSDRTAALSSLFRKIWHTARPTIIGKPAMEPRIWAT